MSSEAVVELKPEELEQLRRDFIVSVFGLLKGLSLYDFQNVALQRPIQNFDKALNDLIRASGRAKLEFKYQDSLLWIMGFKVTNHFSVVEALKYVTESVEIAMIETLVLEPNLSHEVIGEFFSKWALHCSIHKKPKAIQAEVKGIQLTHVDPSKANLRLKSKGLLLSPEYALKHYYLLKMNTQEFFRGITSNEVISQKKLRRELLELAEILKVAPYQLVALSLIREENADPTGFSSAVSQAISTALLSMVLAKELNFPLREQVNIGLVGLMYNVGLLGPEGAAILKNDRLTPNEYKKVLDAQASGVYKLIKIQGSSRPVLERLLAIFEYARSAGSESVSLTLESRLLKLVSQYVALTSERPFRDAYTPLEAVKLLGSKALIAKGADLDPILYYVFVRFIGVYPVGSLCLLSTGEKAIIYRPSGEKAGVPLVKKLSANPEEHATLIDLSMTPNVQVVKSLDAKRDGIQVASYFFE